MAHCATCTIAYAVDSPLKICVAVSSDAAAFRVRVVGAASAAGAVGAVGAVGAAGAAGG